MGDVPTNFYRINSSDTAQVIMHYEEAPTIKKHNDCNVGVGPALTTTIYSKHWTTDNQ